MNKITFTPEEILHSNGMSARPEYYAGRGSIIDLSSTLLNQIADDVKKHYGKDASNEYVKMVWQMKKLSAAAFVQNFLSLANSNFNLSAISLTDSDEYFENQTQALAMIASKCGPTIDHTNYIRQGFRRPL